MHEIYFYKTDKIFTDINYCSNGSIFADAYDAYRGVFWSKL